MDETCRQEQLQTVDVWNMIYGESDVLFWIIHDSGYSQWYGCWETPLYRAQVNIPFNEEPSRDEVEERYFEWSQR